MHAVAGQKDLRVEDDGFVVVQMFHPQKLTTDFAVLGAQTIELLATIELKYHVPLGFHVGGLSYFAKSRISLVLQRDFFLQSNEIYASAEDPTMPVPDLIICLHGRPALNYSANFELTTTRLHGVEIPVGMSYETP
ncbi:hypothetical protein BGZ99_001642, partial [Dissophora globulifera]